MAKIKDGHIEGKIGPVVGCKWKGKPYLRRKAVRRSPPTPGESKNRYIFDLVVDWLKPIHDFVRTGFRNYRETFWGINAANSLIHKQALHRDGYDSFIEPSLVQVSSGSLELPVDIEVIADTDKLLFSWSTEVGPGKDHRDRIMMMAYNVEKKTAAYELSGPKRFEGYASLSLKPIEQGEYHIYAAFVGSNEEKQSDSRYLGSIIF